MTAEQRKATLLHATPRPEPEPEPAGPSGAVSRSAPGPAQRRGVPGVDAEREWAATRLQAVERGRQARAAYWQRKGAGLAAGGGGWQHSTNSYAANADFLPPYSQYRGRYADSSRLDRRGGVVRPTSPPQVRIKTAPTTSSSCSVGLAGSVLTWPAPQGRGSVSPRWALTGGREASYVSHLGPITSPTRVGRGSPARSRTFSVESEGDAGELGLYVPDVPERPPSPTALIASPRRPYDSIRSELSPASDGSAPAFPGETVDVVGVDGLPRQGILLSKSPRRTSPMRTVSHSSATSVLSNLGRARSPMRSVTSPLSVGQSVRLALPHVSRALPGTPASRSRVRVLPATDIWSARDSACCCCRARGCGERG